MVKDTEPQSREQQAQDKGQARGTLVLFYILFFISLPLGVALTAEALDGRLEPAELGIGVLLLVVSCLIFFKRIL